MIGRFSRRGQALAALLTGVVVLSGCSPAPGGPSAPPSPAWRVHQPPDPTSPSGGLSSGRPLLTPPSTPFAGLPPSSKTGRARYLDQPRTWVECGTGRQCARFLVPLDYDDLDGGASLTVGLKRRLHRGAKLGTLFINPGGPGGSGTEMVDWFHPDALAGYDIVGWDARGAGATNPVRCFGSADLDRYNAIDVSPDSPAEEQTLIDELRRFGASCAADSGTLLEHVSTTDTVRDLDLIREWLGEPKLDYLGYSYGTMIGSLYAQLFPGQVGRMVLDGAVDISTEHRVSQIAGFERAFKHFSAWCARQHCPLGGTQDAVAGEVVDLLLSLDARPLTVGDRQLSQQQGVAALLGQFYDGDGAWPDLRDHLVQATRGDGSGLLADADSANFRSGDEYGQFIYAFPAIRCLDEPADSVTVQTRAYEAQMAQAPLLNALSGPDYGCAEWPVAPAPAMPHITAPGAPPILVLGSTGDPATPYEWAVGMAHQLESGVLVTRVGEGHTAFGRRTCVDSIVYAFYRQNQVPPDNTRC